MKTTDILRPLSKLDLKKLSRSELEELFLGEQNLRLQGEEEKKIIEEKYVIIKSKIFGRSSEKSKKEKTKRSNNKIKSNRTDFSKNLSDRYPNVDIQEVDIELEALPICSCCSGQMLDSGMTEDSEYLSVIPKKYLIVKQKRHKYRCGKCHGEVQTAPGVPRIAPGSSYGDEVIIDVGLSKYCDLIPVERYSMMAARQGLKNLPANSLISLTHFLAEFLDQIYKNLLEEIKNSRVIQADETPHKMLEGHEKSNWYLWGFSSTKACYFESHETRSGDVASEFLKESSCEVLVSDVYSGYAKAIRETNIYRMEKHQNKVIAGYCNAHARRKFDEAKYPFEKEANYYLEKYQQIYKLNAESKDKNTDEVVNLRLKMLPYFEEMKKQSEIDLLGVSTKSSLARAINYYLNSYEGLTYFTKDSEVPIDNNLQERVLRNPVIGRKTWYGTHSVKGARTAAILFSIIESCKMNKVNPREYFKDIVNMLHEKRSALTPWEYHQHKETS